MAGEKDDLTSPGFKAIAEKDTLLFSKEIKNVPCNTFGFDTQPKITRTGVKRQRNEDIIAITQEAEKAIELITDPNVQSVLTKVVSMLKYLTQGMGVLLADRDPKTQVQFNPDLVQQNVINEEPERQHNVGLNKQSKINEELNGQHDSGLNKQSLTNEKQKKQYPRDEKSRRELKNQRPDHADPSNQNQGNGKAALRKKTYSQVAAFKVVGRKNDTIEVKPLPPCVEQLETTPNISEEIKQKLILNPKPPQHHKMTVLRYSRMAPRTKVNAKEWLNILKQQGIKPHSILFPEITTIELILPEDQVQTTRAFFKSLNRVEEDPDPYARRDGQPLQIPSNTLQHYLKIRIQMLRFERSIVTAKYLQQTIQNGVNRLQPTQQVTYQQQLKDVLTQKRMYSKKNSLSESLSLLINDQQ